MFLYMVFKQVKYAQLKIKLTFLFTHLLGKVEYRFFFYLENNQMLLQF